MTNAPRERIRAPGDVSWHSSAASYAWTSNAEWLDAAPHSMPSPGNPQFRRPSAGAVTTSLPALPAPARVPDGTRGRDRAGQERRPGQYHGQSHHQGTDRVGVSGGERGRQRRRLYGDAGV